MSRFRGRAAFLAFAVVVAGCKNRDAAAPVAADTGTVGGASDADRVRAADVSILFLGNSHTRMHDLPGLVAGMIQFRRPEATVYTHYLPVGFLEGIATDPAALAEVDSRPWKFVVLQAQKISTSGTINYSRTDGIEYAKRAKGAGATVVFYPEWGLRGKPGDGGRQEGVYRDMAREAAVGVAPVARAWDLALADRPELPLHSPDGNHQSAVGAFLTACVLYGRLTGDSPAALAVYPYPGADEADRRFLADIAARALAAE